MTNPNGNITNGVAWTADDLETLKRLWYVERLTMLQIGIEMGRSRNSIAGKINRITRKEKIARRGLTEESRQRITFKNKTREPRKRTSMPKVKFPPTSPPPVAVDAPISSPFICYDEGDGPVEYLKLRDHHCRQLLQERGSDGLLLSCGKPKIILDYGESSYCPAHHRLNVNPWATRRADGQISKVRA